MSDSLPQNLDAEKQLLGAMILDGSTVDDVSSICSPGMFYAPRHATIAEVISELHSAGVGVDHSTVAHHLEKRGSLEAVGGVPYLLELFESVPHTAHAPHYAEIVRTKFKQRTAVIALRNGLETLQKPLDDDGIAEALHAAENGIHAALEDSQTDEPKAIGDTLQDCLAELMAGRGMQRTTTSGFRAIDQHIGGIPAGGMTIVAARPSVGKTSLMLGSAIRIAETGLPVLFCSYEQVHSELTGRCLSLFSGIGLTRLQRGGLSRSENDRIGEAAAMLSRLPVYFDDVCRSESALLAQIRLMVRRLGVRAVLIDYLQLIPPNDRKANREQQVAGLSRSLKLLAMQTDAAIVVASQLNRQAEQRDNKRPRLSDLRESGAIEQDADVVLFLHRPHKDDPNEADDHAELIIGKNRNGPCGTVRLDWHPQCARYTDPPEVMQ